MLIRDNWQFSMDQRRKKLKVELLLSDDRILHQFIVERIRGCVQLKKINSGGTFIESEGIIGKKEFYRDSHRQIKFFMMEDNRFCFNLFGFVIHGFQCNLEDFQEIKEVELSVTDGSEFKIETLKDIQTLYHIQEFSVKGIKKIVDIRPTKKEYYEVAT